MVTIVQTLTTMAGIYRMPREGGPASPRFQAYHALVASTHGLSAYNPMAGPHALEAVEALLAIDAESIASDAAHDTCARLEYDGDVTLAVVLAAPGYWTDRVATDVRHRTLDARTPHQGLIYQWTRETPTVASVRREAIAETVRVIHTAVHGPATTVRAVLAREGLAEAMDDAPVAALTDAEAQRVLDALDLVGDATSASDIVAITLGDDAATAMGYIPLGLAFHAGVRWAATRARAMIAAEGAPATLAAW
jgi:hypothetical protein